MHEDGVPTIMSMLNTLKCSRTWIILSTIFARSFQLPFCQGGGNLSRSPSSVISLRPRRKKKSDLFGMLYGTVE